MYKRIALNYYIRENFSVLVKRIVIDSLFQVYRQSIGVGFREIKQSIGIGSYIHTNFRMALAPRIVSVMKNTMTLPIQRAWVHSLDVTESDSAAVDTAGDGSPCDGYMGSNLYVLAQIPSSTNLSSGPVIDLNNKLIQMFSLSGLRVVDDYLSVKFITLENIINKKGDAIRVTSPYYPATEIELGYPIVSTVRLLNN